MDFGQLWDIWVQLWLRKWIWSTFQLDHQVNPENRHCKYSKKAAVSEFAKIGRSPPFLDWSTKKEIFLFNRPGLKGLKNFIIQNGKKVMNKILSRLEIFKQTHNKLTLAEKTEYEKIAKKELGKPTTTYSETIEQNIRVR